MQMTGQRILEATSDPHLFGPWFKDKWFKQKAPGKLVAYLAAVFGLPITEIPSSLRSRITSLTEPPDGGAQRYI